MLLASGRRAPKARSGPAFGPCWRDQARLARMEAMLPLLCAFVLSIQDPSQGAPRPLSRADEIGVEFVFSYEESYAKDLGSGTSFHFTSTRHGAVNAKLKRYRAYAGVDSFTYRGPAQGVVSVNDKIVWSSAGGDVTESESGAGEPSEAAVTVHFDTKRGVYSFGMDFKAPTKVVKTGPGTSTNDPNTAGLSWSSPEFPLIANAPTVLGSTSFTVAPGSGSLGSNVVAMGRTMKHMDGQPLAEVKLNWLLERPGPKPEVELTFEVENYDTWLPEGPQPGQAQDAHGNHANVTAHLARKDGQPLERGALFMSFELKECSSEPGICINTPPEGEAASLKDLRFIDGGDAQPKGEEKQRAQTPFGDWQTASALVGALDWGAYGVLEVKAYVPHTGEVVGRFVPTNEKLARLPKRKPDSYIGDAWKAQHGVEDLPDDDDLEQTQGNTHHGDGYSLYEEYRGVFALGKHSRTSEKAALLPKKKDLVVLLSNKSRPEHPGPKEPVFLALGESALGQLEGGFALFESATQGARALPMKEEEAQASRMINVCQKSHHKEAQYGVLMLRAPSAGQDAGGCYPLELHPKSPKTADWVAFDLDGNAAMHEKLVEKCKNYGISVPFTAHEDLANTVAHELSHACGLDHHGDRETDGPTRKREELVPADKFHLYDYKGVELLGDQIPNPIDGSIAPDFSSASGDMACIMTYTNAYTWRLTTGGGYFWHEVLPTAPGHTLCTGRDGNPLNVIYGQAAANGGNCRSKLNLHPK